MGILRVMNLSKSFGIETLFQEVGFDVRRGDKVGFVGANGTGKSTLMRCLIGREEFDSGSVSLESADTIGYVEQEAAFDDRSLWAEFRSAFADLDALKAQMDNTAAKIERERDEATMEALMKSYAQAADRYERAGGYDYESRIKKVAFGLGFIEADFAKLICEFSGGQRTRISLAKALLREPDFLFLDEPTNHLDIGMVEWLENFLIGYKGGVLLISHDRFFLDRVTNRIIELENKTVEAYKGNYSAFCRVKADRRAALESAYEKQQAHIHKTEEYIRRYKAGIKSKQARGREKQLNRLARIVLPPDSVGFNYFAFNPPGECAERVAELENAAAAYGEKEIFSGVSLLVRRGDGVALVGPNGAGKTTLLKLLVGEMEAAAGRINLGNRVKIGYFSQQHEGLNPASKLIDELVYTYDLTEEQARHYLGAFLFRGDDVYKLIGDLSGGEKARLAFLKLLMEGANFLVLDEPTNHLDIPAKEAVEEALMAFPGTFIAVSHDRYFLDKVTNCTLEMENGSVTEYGGNYTYYREKKAALAQDAADAAARAPGKKETAPTAAADKATAEKKGRQRALSETERRKMAQQYEGEIVMLEMELKGLEYQMNHPDTHSDIEKSQAIAEAYAKAEKKLAKTYDLWAECAETVK